MCQRFAHKYAEERVLNVFDVRIQVGVLWLQDNFSYKVRVKSAISGFAKVS